MADISAFGASIGTSNLGSSLTEILLSDEIQPGSEPSYHLCKLLFTMHPLGAKMAKNPVRLAMSQSREITVPAAPDMVADEFRKGERKLGVKKGVENVATLSRVYGASSLIIVAERNNVAIPLDKPLTPQDLADPAVAVGFNVLDPLNTAGANLPSQDPRTLTFQRGQSPTVSGTKLHSSRVVVLMNEDPVYIEYTSSALGYTGRSVYQRALFPMKTFLQTMITDDLVVMKSGLLIAMIKQAGSVVSNAMAAITGFKRSTLKAGTTGNVLSIGDSDKIESLNLQNLEGPFKMARMNALENCAAAGDMPSILLNSETYAAGFGEGSEDAKSVAHFVDTLREAIQPAYDFTDRIVMYRSWTPQFYSAVQARFPDDYDGVSYEDAFIRWSNSFSAVWPSLLTEPESEKVKTDDVKLKSLIATAQIFLPEMDPANKVEVIRWFEGNVNQNRRMFNDSLSLDFDALKEYLEKKDVQGDAAADAASNPDDEEPPAPAPFAAADSGSVARLRPIR